ncbi:MAG: hypothetical protein KIS96_11490 [Bauldia sp.]|nr:hypothetical protein [Bauldia sp.]
MSERLPKMVRHILAEASEICAPHGIAVVYQHGTRHPRLILTGLGQRRVKALSKSPRDEDNAEKMALADVRRILREMTEAVA